MTWEEVEIQRWEDDGILPQVAMESIPVNSLFELNTSITKLRSRLNITHQT